jgi:hypothetical protein
MCLGLGYPNQGPDAFGYDLTTVGSQESRRLFALPSVLFSYGSRRNSLTVVIVSKKDSRLLLGKLGGAVVELLGGSKVGFLPL